MTRYRMALIGGPNCGSAILTDVASWPPPPVLTVKGHHGFYTRISVLETDEGTETYWPDARCSSATYEWRPA